MDTDGLITLAQMFRASVGRQIKHTEMELAKRLLKDKMRPDRVITTVIEWGISAEDTKY
jgi:hypothetical protein